MTYEELLQLIKEQKGSLTAEQWLAISACGLMEVFKTAAATINNPPPPCGAVTPRKIGRPLGAKDKQPRKRRRNTGDGQP